MVKRDSIAEIWLWNHLIGAVSWDNEQEVATFEYNKSFIKSGIELSPLTMPLQQGLYNFPNLNRQSYFGLPGMLADVLPDKFGNAIINQWLAQE